MNDTPISIQRKQFETYHAKSMDEKFRMVAEMIEYGINQTKSVLAQWYPQKSGIALQIEFFKIYYKNDLDSKKMSRLISQMSNLPPDS